MKGFYGLDIEPTPFVYKFIPMTNSIIHVTIIINLRAWWCTSIQITELFALDYIKYGGV